MRVRWSPLAFSDLKAISDYLESERGAAAAVKVCRAIYDSIQTLRRFPEAGKPGMEEGCRDLVVSRFPSYIVAYRIEAVGAVQILRILAWCATAAPVTVRTFRLEETDVWAKGSI